MGRDVIINEIVNHEYFEGSRTLSLVAVLSQ